MKASKVSDLLEKISKAIKNPDFPIISKLEYDLLMQQLRELYDELDSLKTQDGHQVTDKIKVIEVKVEETQRAEEVPVKTTLHANKGLLIDESQPVKQTPAASTESTTLKVAKEMVEAKLGASRETNTRSTINESVKSQSSLNEKLKTAGKEVHKKLATKPLKDLIDLNKKFVLLNELFKGNAEAYSSAIAHIDSLEEYSEAESFIRSQLMSNYFWDESAVVTRMFMKLVKQKFGTE